MFPASLEVAKYRLSIAETNLTSDTEGERTLHMQVTIFQLLDRPAYPGAMQALKEQLHVCIYTSLKTVICSKNSMKARKKSAFCMQKSHRSAKQREICDLFKSSQSLKMNLQN